MQSLVVVRALARRTLRWHPVSAGLRCAVAAVGELVAGTRPHPPRSSAAQVVPAVRTPQAAAALLVRTAAQVRLVAMGPTDRQPIPRAVVRAAVAVVRPSWPRRLAAMAARAAQAAAVAAGVV